MFEGRQGVAPQGQAPSDSDLAPLRDTGVRRPSLFLGSFELRRPFGFRTGVSGGAQRAVGVSRGDRVGMTVDDPPSVALAPKRRGYAENEDSDLVAVAHFRLPT